MTTDQKIPNWTVDPTTGAANSSPLFEEICEHVAAVIRNEAASLLNGNTLAVAGIIVSHLANLYHLAPQDLSINTASRIDPFDAHYGESDFDQHKRWLGYITVRNAPGAGSLVESVPENVRLATEISYHARSLGISRKELALRAQIDPVWIGLLYNNLLYEEEILPEAIARLKGIRPA
jgi:hypothetical protein